MERLTSLLRSASRSPVHKMSADENTPPALQPSRLALKSPLREAAVEEV